MGQARFMYALLLLGGFETALAADNAVDDEVLDADEAAGAEHLPRRLDWYDSYAHVVRFDVSLGEAGGRDLGAGGLALQWEWWPTEHLSYTARTWMQAISVQPDAPELAPATREASGVMVGAQVATPGPVKALAGVGVGLAAVNGRLPPSDRWRLRAIPYAGVVEAHGGVVLIARPITLAALGWVHLYSEGPPVFSVSIGGGAAIRPRPPETPTGTR